MTALEPSKEKPSLWIGTRAVKYLIQFSIWNREAKNLNSIYDLLVNYVRKKIKNIFMKMVLVRKKFSFFNEKLRRKSFVKRKSSQ